MGKDRRKEKERANKGAPPAKAPPSPSKTPSKASPPLSSSSPSGSRSHSHSHTNPHSHAHHSHGIYVEEADQQEDALKEKEHFEGVVNAFATYSEAFDRRLLLATRRFEFLPKHMKEKVPHFGDKISRIKEAAQQNQHFLHDLVQPHMIFENDSDIAIEDPAPGKGDQRGEFQKNHEKAHQIEGDHDKVKSTLKQCYRDWSAEGAQERDQTYAPILVELEKEFPHATLAQRDPVKILVPGAGLGRLAFEIAKKGYHCQGNEFSYFMLIASNYFLNRVEKIDQFEIYPFLHQFSNVWSEADQLRAVRIPDVIPQNLPEGSDFSMTAGDFLEVYGGQRAEWDCVITSFFIDTAKNILAYIEVIEKILKPGGKWINLGPLLYHFEDMMNEISIELTYDELKDVIRSYGLKIERESRNQASYCNNDRSLQQSNFTCALFVVSKPLP